MLHMKLQIIDNVIFLYILVCFTCNQSEIPDDTKNKLLELCSGHPFLLNMCREVGLRDATFIRDVVQKSASNMPQGDFIQEILTASFDSLAEEERRILLSVLIFKTGTTLDVLHLVSDTVSNRATNCSHISSINTINSDISNSNTGNSDTSNSNTN